LIVYTHIDHANLRSGGVHDPQSRMV